MLWIFNLTLIYWFLVVPIYVFVIVANMHYQKLLVLNTNTNSAKSPHILSTITNVLSYFRVN